MSLVFTSPGMERRKKSPNCQSFMLDIERHNKGITRVAYDLYTAQPIYAPNVVDGYLNQMTMPEDYSIWNCVWKYI